MKPSSHFSTLIFLLVVLSTSAYSQTSNDSIWIRTNKGCRIYNPHPVKNETISWSGDCTNGFASGHGTLVWYKNTKASQEYSGSMKRGVPHGHGKYKYNNKSTDEGEYRYGKLQGLGKSMTPLNNGQSLYYYGEFTDGNWNGYGTHIYLSSSNDTISIYTGYFKDNALHGPGTLKTIQGITSTVTKASFNKGVPEGDVDIAVLESTTVIRHYKGNYHNQMQNGYGELTIGSHRYAGEWKDDDLEGKGELWLDTTLVYKGDWQHGKLNGLGTRTYPDGSRTVGEFRDNQRNGFCVTYFPSGEMYVGVYRKDLHDTIGYFTKNGKIVQCGEWHQGKQVRKKSYQEAKKIISSSYADQLSYAGITLE